MKNFKSRNSYLREELKPWTDYPEPGEYTRTKINKMYTPAEVRELCGQAFMEGRRTKDFEAEEIGTNYFGKWCETHGLNENVLPRPYKIVKCLECGEKVCDNIDKKIGHLYNRHNCKPSVGDYKAKKMLSQYFN